MTWRDRPMLAIDTETTGTDPETARIVQITLGMSGEPGRWAPSTHLINPGVPIPPEASVAHGINDEQAMQGDDPAEVLGFAWISLVSAAQQATPIVAHNAAYDLTVLDREFRRHGVAAGVPDGLIVLDTLVLFRRFDWTTGGRSLSKLADRHGITFPAHDAEADALTSLRLIHILAERNDVLPLVPAASLHEAQRGWWGQQQDAAEAKAAGNGSTFTRQPHWPLIPTPSPVLPEARP